jgi:hypothetical protein
MTGVPIELDRDDARRLARLELADPVYDTEPPLLQQVMERIVREINDLIGNAAGALGNVGGLIVLTLIVLIVGVILIRYRPLARRAAAGADPVFTEDRRSAASYRSPADAADADEDWSASVLERYRAIVATFEERAVLAPRAGRTADEAASEAGRSFPHLGADLSAGATVFDGVRYGGRTASRSDAAALRDLDRSISTAKAARLDVDDTPALAVPR